MEWQDASGGTTVVANPSGTGTTDLSKLQVGDSIYNVPSGGTTINDGYTFTQSLQPAPAGGIYYILGLYNGRYGWHYINAEDFTVTKASLVVILSMDGLESVTSDVLHNNATTITASNLYSNLKCLLYLTGDCTIIASD